MPDGKVEISSKGQIVKVDSVKVDNKVIIVSGKLLKVARLGEEWFEDVGDPDAILKVLKSSHRKPDIFTFWQRLPDTQPKYEYYKELESVAAIPIKNFDYWWNKQIEGKYRNRIRKAQKDGIVLRLADFDDHFVKGMVDIFNETPIRQGKPFWHYGKDFGIVKREFSRYLYREEAIGAYYKDDLIGFIMLSYAGQYALLGQIISKIEYRDKYVNNALIAKAVEVCDQKRIPYLCYYGWRAGSLGDFQRHNGFEKVDLPRYYIPLTFRGRIWLKLGLHHGYTGMLPEGLVNRLKDLRTKWYARRYGKGSY